MKALALVIALIITPLSIADDSHFAPPGEISIIVYATNGHPLPGATVTLESGDIHIRVMTVVTADDGAVRFDRLVAGNYFVTASLSGFLTQTTGRFRSSSTSRRRDCRRYYGSCSTRVRTTSTR